MRMSDKQMRMMSQPHLLTSSLSSLISLDGQDHEIECSVEQSLSTNDRKKLQKRIART